MVYAVGCLACLCQEDSIGRNTFFTNGGVCEVCGGIKETGRKKGEREREKERRERFWKSSRKGLGENSRTNAPTWNTHQILDIFF